MVQHNVVTLFPITDQYNTYNELAKVHHNKLSQFTVNQSIDVVFPGWIDGNLCTMVSALIDSHAQRGVNIHPSWQKKETKEFLQHNGFFIERPQGMSADSSFSIRSSCIRYKEFKRDQPVEDFNVYLERYLQRGHFPKMSNAVWQKITDCMSELFLNACQHSDCRRIYVCGQNFPKKRKLDFAIVDSGIGFKRRVKKSLDIDMQGDEAIKWCMLPGNTTKRCEPGGVGLGILMEFVKLNGGKMQVISGDGFYQLKGDKEQSNTLAYELPFTVFNLEIKTDDIHSYRLTSEQ